MRLVFVSPVPNFRHISPSNYLTVKEKSKVHGLARTEKVCEGANAVVKPLYPSIGSAREKGVGMSNDDSNIW